MGKQEAVEGGGANKKEKMHSVEWLMPTPKKKYGPSLPQGLLHQLKCYSFQCLLNMHPQSSILA